MLLMPKILMGPGLYYLNLAFVKIGVH